LSFTGDSEHPGTFLALLTHFSIAILPLFHAYILARLLATVAHPGIVLPQALGKVAFIRTESKNWPPRARRTQRKKDLVLRIQDAAYRLRGPDL
jgi:hypothetical protein